MAEIPKIKYLPFVPFPGLGSPTIQTVLSNFLPAGKAPPAMKMIVSLSDGDTLFCYISTPPLWKETQKTVLLLHGLGGDYSSEGMVRLARKLFQAGHRVVRVNMRSAGTASAQTRRPYHAGISSDVLNVLKFIKEQTPLSTLILIGFSLGGNVALKLGGELGEEARNFIDLTIAVCAPIDLANASSMISNPSNRRYSNYFVKNMSRQTEDWTLGRSFDTLYEYDNMVTAPQWGFRDADDYYRQCSSRYVLPNIQHPCYMVFTEDDPFVDYTLALQKPLHSCVQVWVSKKGGHLGFIGWTKGKNGIFWLDEQLLKWVDEFGPQRP